MSALQLNTRFTLTMPEGTITESGKALIMAYMNSQRIREGIWRDLNPDVKHHYILPLPDDWAWVWTVTGKGDYVGTFPKRVSKYIHKTMGLKCPTEFLAEIGNIAKDHSSDASAYEFEFVNHADWYQGDYGDGGSCWWGEYADGKEAFIDNGGHAIRFYRGSRGIGRAWVMPIEDDMFIVFNGYGLVNPTLSIVRIMSQFLGMTYKKITLGNEYGQIYINGDTGYVIGHEDTIENIGDSYEFSIEVESGYRCVNCEDRVSEDGVYIAPNGDTYCESCFFDNCGYCAQCDETHWSDDLTYVKDHGDYCDDCRDKKFMECGECGEYLLPDNVTCTDDACYCDDCRSLKLEYCNECGEWKDKEEFTDSLITSGERVCEECRAKEE